MLSLLFVAIRNIMGNNLFLLKILFGNTPSQDSL